MKTKDIHDLTDKEIVVRIKEEKDHLMRLRMNNAISAIERPSRIRDSRKTIARLMTILNQRHNQK